MKNRFKIKFKKSPFIQAITFVTIYGMMLLILASSRVQQSFFGSVESDFFALNIFFYINSFILALIVFLIIRESI